MKKNVLMLSLFAVLILSVVFVEGAIRSDAKTAGYHNITYTNSIQSLDDSLNYIRILPQTFAVGWAVAGGSLNFVGDASGNYVINAAGSSITFSDNMTVKGYASAHHLRIIDYGPVIDNNGYWIGEPIDSSNINNYDFAGTGTCPVGQVVTAISTTGVTCGGVPSGDGGTVPGSCLPNFYVVGTTSSGVTCAPITSKNVTGDAAAGNCPAGQVVMNTTAEGVDCVALPTGSGSTGNCAPGQVVMNVTDKGVECVAVGGSSQWITNGSNIYYDSGRVGIGPGSGNPTTTLYVAGSIKSDGSIVSNTEVFANKVGAISVMATNISAGTYTSSGNFVIRLS